MRLWYLTCVKGGGSLALGAQVQTPPVCQGLGLGHQKSHVLGRFVLVSNLGCRVDAAGVEPGLKSTLKGWPGTCPSQDCQPWWMGIV
jgi:hypothetical protein